VTRMDGTALGYAKLGLDNPPFVARGVT
jgi:hypothetical protein